MAERKINFYKGVSLNNRITFFVPPDEFSAHSLLDVYPAECFKTDQALVIKFKMPGEQFFATDLSNLDAILSGEKQVWMAHLNPEFGYVLDQCRLDFNTAAAVPVNDL